MPRALNAVKGGEHGRGRPSVVSTLPRVCAASRPTWIDISDSTSVAGTITILFQTVISRDYEDPWDFVH